MFVLITNVYAQPRVDGGTNAKVVHSSPLVNNFIGWSFNSKSQKWIGYYNTISSWYSKNYKKPIKPSPESMSYDDNIINLSFKKIIFDHQCPLKNSGDVCKLLKYRVLEQKIDGDDLN